MTRAKKTIAFLATLALVLGARAEAYTVINGYAGAEVVPVQSAKYPVTCFTSTNTIQVNSITVGMYRTSGDFPLEKLVNVNLPQTVWSIGNNDVKATSSNSASMSTTTQYFQIAAGQKYCLYGNSNTGNERFVGVSSDGGLLSQAYGASLTDVINNVLPAQATYMGSVNVWLCDQGEVRCGNSAPTVNIGFPVNATSTPMIQQWFQSLSSAVLNVPPWSYWVQIRSELDADRASWTSTSSRPTATFSIGLASSTLHSDVTLFAEEDMTKFIPAYIWTLLKTVMASVMWVGFALMVYNAVDRRFSRHHT